MEKRIVSYGKFRVLFNQYGEVEKLEFRKRIFEGEGDVVHIPLYMLKRVKLSEIPEGVYIQPVLEVKDKIIYTIKYGELFNYEVLLGKGLCIIEVTNRRRYWWGSVNFDAYVEALNGIVSKLERKGFITRHTFLSLDGFENEDFKIEEFYWDDDYFNVSFEYNLPAETTILKAIRFAKDLIGIMENYVKHKTSSFPSRGKRFCEKTVLVKVDSLFRRI